MSFPMGASTITLTGTFPVPVAGSARAGRVVLTPSAVLVDSTQQAIYSGGGPAILDSTGHLSVQLLCTDDPDVQPPGWRWRVDEQPSGGQRRTYWIDLPASLGPSVDLSELSPVSEPDGSGQSLPPTGPAGGALTGTYPNPQLAAATIASFDPAGTASAAQTAAAGDATAKVTAHTTASDPHGDRAAAATDATSKVTAHTAATDPHGDRAYADGKLSKTANLSDLSDVNTARSNLGLGGAAVLNVGTTSGTVTAGNDSRLSNARTPTAHAASHTAAGSDPVQLTQAQISGLVDALAALLPLTGGTLTGGLTLDGANLTVQRDDGTGAYRLRVTGGGLDLEIGGLDVTVSVWSDPNFTGTQANVMRWEAAGPHLIGRTQFGTSPFDTVFDLDAAGGKLGLFGIPAATRQAVTGSRADGTALTSLLTALDLYGLIDDQTTA